MDPVRCLVGSPCAFCRVILMYTTVGGVISGARFGRKMVMVCEEGEGAISSFRTENQAVRARLALAAAVCVAPNRFAKGELAPDVGRGGQDFSWLTAPAAWVRVVFLVFLVLSTSERAVPIAEPGRLGSFDFISIWQCSAFGARNVPRPLQSWISWIKRGLGGNTRRLGVRR